MTEEKIAARLAAAEAFARWVTAVLAALGVGYGVLAFVVGARLWGPPNAPVALYGTAMSVPGAPQTWGAIAAGIGAVMLFAQFTERQLVVMVSCWLWSTWLLFFAITFIADSQSGVGTAIAPSWVYLCLAVLAMLRGELARRWRHE